MIFKDVSLGRENSQSERLYDDYSADQSARITQLESENAKLRAAVAAALPLVTALHKIAVIEMQATTIDPGFARAMSEAYAQANAWLAMAEPEKR